jgi:predicted Zn-dependent protease
VKDEDDLAAVLGHECAHGLVRHAGEKISSNLVLGILGRLSLVFDPTGGILAILLPAANLFRELPNSRQQEMEADQIGVLLAAEACFDPRAAPRVFQAMKDGVDADGHGPPEFLSTHPSHDRRITKFNDYMPDALTVYRGIDGNRCTNIRQAMHEARQIAARQAQVREEKEKQTTRPRQ